MFILSLNFADEIMNENNKILQHHNLRYRNWHADHVSWYVVDLSTKTVISIV